MVIQPACTGVDLLAYPRVCGRRASPRCSDGVAQHPVIGGRQAAAPVGVLGSRPPGASESRLRPIVALGPLRPLMMDGKVGIDEFSEQIISLEKCLATRKI